ncbi:MULTISPECIES: hypothetical protein [Mycolicibacterium]|uniref:Transmembrane protein n=3 Tax=Mycolicibacterium gilvum TaxID=1804 RepID=E6TML7_MYCSR|nr:MULTISPECIES: hypothetical protein [Mycolicibacterium]ABP43575.1 conserved hypothetical protein [Mycolicibacterium gilvum PYR-GCK]ADU01623.1 hypothetical protein Mspyr1_50950 [Mycolicibacterium gilvum Spyr1]MBV5242171.1 hypothetical protein [Mycolicibacterium sp. PAM1]MCV7053940.1 hypothetical protein [Mycolicibacterium gilvum]STZ46201.1 Uncharacterised protein [Mycolicibacterium gilvum]
MTASAQEVVILADHPIWLAVPAFAPALIIAGVIVYIAARNRRRPDQEKEQ